MSQNLHTPVDAPVGAAATATTARRPRTGRALLWGLVPLLSVGLLAWLPFCWLAARTRRWTYGLTAALYAVAALAGLVFMPEDENVDSPWDWLLVAVWFCGLVHTVIAFLLLRDGESVQDTNRAAVSAALARAARRSEARELFDKNPGAARDLRIGRPDLPRGYDDGGLVDLNTVPAAVLVTHLGFSAAEAESVVTVRARMGRFDGLAEVIAFTDLAPARVDAVRDLLVFSA
ncbi:hypothetical protein ACFQVC_41165 [Streptomyces monticola]|uniref:Helix-hairpin-helix domain-containing protein n=1 Tax=Streptomyces monticola TaxID=2666263 RepID=A0ABW2JYH1_9ACTN